MVLTALTASGARARGLSPCRRRGEGREAARGKPGSSLPGHKLKETFQLMLPSRLFVVYSRYQGVGAEADGYKGGTKPSPVTGERSGVGAAGGQAPRRGSGTGYSRDTFAS